MKVAFSVWNNRIAPVFDVARQVHIVESESGRIVGEVEETITNEAPAQKALRLTELGVSTLVCGAISRQLLTTLCAYGICVIPFIAGDVHEVINAHLAGTVDRQEYAMPGCRRRRWHEGRRGGYQESKHSPHGRRKGRTEA